MKTWLDGAALHIRFNNPAKHNALSVDMWEAVPPLLAQAETDDAVRLVVFSGEGDEVLRLRRRHLAVRGPCAPRREAVKRYELMAEAALMGIHDFGKPTIAAIRGYCIGGGVNVAISCDIRLAAADSVFAVPATRLGLGYRFSALKNLVDLVGAGARQGHLLHRAAPGRRGGAAPSAW